MPYRSSAAYQQEFSPAPARPRPKKQGQAKPALRVVEGRKSKVRASLSPRVVVVFLLFVVAICFMVYYQAQLTEVTGEINRLNNQMKRLQSENVRLQSVLEPTESPRLLAERATRELGMHRLDHQNQVSYVFIYEEDQVDVARPEEPEGLVEQVDTALASVGQVFSKEELETE